MSFDYDVFFSYRHKPLDGEITQKVFNRIESYRLPRAIRAQGFPEIRRAFRDTEELPVSRILTDTIDKALHSTNCLVVICSTDTPESEWIDREVSVFIELGRAEHIYPLLISGDAERSFPPSLKLIPDIMDRVMDIRVSGCPVKKMMARADTELLRVIAGVCGCPEAELLREHQLRKNRRFAARATAAAAVFLAVAGVSLGLMHLAREYRSTARQREEASMRILNELTYSLPDHLTNVPGAYSRIAGLLRQNTEDINAILNLSENKDKAGYEAAANYEKLATAESALGAYTQALDSEEQAIGLYTALDANGYAGSGQALASALNNRGRILNAAGAYDEAADAFRQALELPGGEDPLFRAQVAHNAGANAVDAGDAAQAADCFEQSLQLLAGLPESPETLDAAARANYNYGVLLYRSGNYAQAEERLRQACDGAEELLTAADSLQNRNRYIQSVSVLAACLSNQGRYAEADLSYEQAIQTAEDLSRGTDNLEDLRRLAELYNNRGLSRNNRGEYEAAGEDYERAASLCGEIFSQSGADTDAALYALALLNSGENAYKAGDYAGSRRLFREGLERYGAVCDALGDMDRSQYCAWLSYDALIHQGDPQAALDAALEACRLQPDSVQANLNLAYACLYGGYEETAQDLIGQIAALGAGLPEAICMDLEAQQRAGLEAESAGEILARLQAAT